MAFALLFCNKVGAPGEVCDAGKARECYNGVVGSLLEEFSQHPFSISRLDGLCAKTGPSFRRWTPRPRVDPVNSSVTDPPGKVPASAVLQNHFDWSDDLEAELTRCFISVGPPCRPNQRRSRYARRTLAMLLDLKGCTLSNNNPFVQGDDAQLLNDEAQPDSQVLCSYKQRKRCLEKQIHEIPHRLDAVLKKGLTPDDRFIGGICRKTRKMCHQHNRVDTCDTNQQDAIRRMEEAMDLAQDMLCKNNRTLLQNLLFTYKSWNIQDFAKCSRDVQVNSLTDHLFFKQRIEADCRELKSRVYRCLNDSYVSIMNDVDPKPDGAGAVEILSVFLDRINCLSIDDLPHGGSGAYSTSYYNDLDYPADQVPYTEDESVRVITTQPSQDSPNDAHMLKLRTSICAGLTSLLLVEFQLKRFQMLIL